MLIRGSGQCDVQRGDEALDNGDNIVVSQDADMS
jgi:hypothetical protein